MSEQVVEGAEQAADPDETSEEDTDEQPEISEDEFADVDLDAVSERAEEEAGADADDEEADSEAADEESDEAADSGAERAEPSGESWGDMYVGTLTTLSNAAIEEHGKPDAEQIDESLARQLHLDEYMDDLMAKHGKREEMPPEQALLLSTSMFLVMVLGTKTELPSKVLEEFDF